MARPQEPRTITLSAQPTCRACRVQVENVLTIGEADGERALPNIGSVTIDLRGRIWITGAEAQAEALLFDWNGRFVDVIGKPGAGPGEFRQMRRPVHYGDTTYVLDPRNRRISLFSADLQFARSISSPGLYRGGLVLLNRSTAVINAVDQTRGGSGALLHVIDMRDGNHRPIPASRGAYRFDTPMTATRVLAKSNRNTVWAAHADRYVIEAYTTSGELRTRIVRSASWLERGGEPRSLYWLHSIHVDRHDRLWVLGGRPDARYAESSCWDSVKGQTSPSNRLSQRGRACRGRSCGRYASSKADQEELCEMT